MKKVIEKFKPNVRYNRKAMALWVGIFAAIGITTLLLTKAATPSNTLSSANCGTSPVADSRTRNVLYNVTNYGATGDGSANDTVAVQNAINAAKADGGGTVWFPQGVYQVRNVQIFAGITYTGTNATIQHIPGYGKDDQIFRAPKNTNYYNNPQVYNGYNGTVESPPLVVKCLIFDGNRPAGAAYWGHQLEHAHLLYLTSEQPSAGRLRTYVEDSIFINGTADGISIGTGVYATINRILMKDVFRGGFVVTGDNNKVDVNSFRYIQSTGHDDSMDIEVDDPAVNGRGLNEINIYNSDLDRTLDVDMGFVYYSQSYGGGSVSSVDSRTIFRLNNVSIAKSPFDLNMPNSNFCALHTTTHIGKVNDGNQVGRLYFGNTIEFKDSNIILSDDNPVDDTNGPIRVGYHPTVEGFGFASQQIRFESVHFSKDASASITANVLDVTGRRASDKIAIINSTIDSTIPAPVVSSDGSSTAYSTTAAEVPAKCDWSTAPSFTNEITKVPVLNGAATTYNVSFDQSYNLNGTTPAPTPTPTPAPTPTPSIAPVGVVDDNAASFVYSSSPAWEYYPPGTDAVLYQGGNHTSNITNASTTFTFHGGGVELYGTKAANYGKAHIVIDNGTANATDIDLYQAVRAEQALIFQKTGLTNADHTITITVLGTHNSSSTDNYVVIDKAVVTAYVTPASDTTPPSVNITAPASNATVSGGSVTLSATASDNVAVTKVEFYMNNTLLGTDTASPYTFGLNTTLYPDGSYTLTTKAYDLAGNSNTASVTVTVNNTVTPPTTKKADFNNDNLVDTNDLFILLANFNKTVPSGTKGDASGDGKVDTNDLFILLGVYGK